MVETARTRPPAHYWAATLLAPLLVAATCLAAVAYDMAWLDRQPAAGLATDRAVSLCVSMRLSGGWRAAAWWEAAVSNRTGRVHRPFVQPGLACALVPWQSWLPSGGTLQTSN
jgi:hypothetical protein